VVENITKTAAEAARRVTMLLDFHVLVDTIQKLIKHDQATVCRSGPKGKFSEEEMGVLEVASCPMYLCHRPIVQRKKHPGT
jgi:hypothetical protein